MENRRLILRRRQKIAPNGAAHILADVLGLDEADAKGLILGRQTWKMYKENNLEGRLPSYQELKRMCGKKCGCSGCCR